MGAIAVASIGGFTAISIILGMIGISLYRLQVVPANTISVIGSASQDEVNQYASFNANVSVTGASKEEVNEQMQDRTSSLIETAKEFGIEEKNIKTQYVNIYQEEFTDYESPDLSIRRGPWRGTTSINFQRVDSNRAQEFAEVLVASGATSFDGPNFSLDDADEIENQLMIQALNNAKEKAQTYAQSQNKSLGEILTIDTAGTGNNFQPFYRLQGGGGGGESAYNPGSSEVTSTVTVVYELK